METNLQKKEKANRIKLTSSLYYQDESFNSAREKISEELDKLEKLGLSKAKLPRITKFYKIHRKIEIGEVSKCLILVKEVLSKIGLSEEEINKYIDKNSVVYINSYSYLLKRLQIFNKCKILKEVLLHHSSILGFDYIDSDISLNALYKYAKEKDFKLNDEDIENFKLVKKTY